MPVQVRLARRLSLEWQAYVVRTHALRKVFVTVKGFHYQVQRHAGQGTGLYAFTNRCHGICASSCTLIAHKVTGPATTTQQHVFLLAMSSINVSAYGPSPHL